MKTYLLLAVFLIGCDYDAEQNNLIRAIENENLVFIQDYLSDNKNAEFYYYDGFTPLTYSAKGSCFECVRILLDGGVDIDKTQRGGLSATSWAVVNNDVRLLQYLLGAGANPQTKCTGEKCLNAFELASKRGNKQIKRILNQE